MVMSMASVSSSLIMAGALWLIISTNYYYHYSNNCKQPSISISPLRHNTSHYYYNKKKISISAKSNLNYSPPLISPDDRWGIWSALFATVAFGLWSERTKIGRIISAALVCILLGLAASNLGIIPHQAHPYSVVMEFLLPLIIPLMLFRADMRNAIKSTGREAHLGLSDWIRTCFDSVGSSWAIVRVTVLVYWMSFTGPLKTCITQDFTLRTSVMLKQWISPIAVATMVGTLVAFMIVPMRSLDQDSWKIAAALMASYIGGAINYVAVSDALAISPSVIVVGVAA